MWFPVALFLAAWGLVPLWRRARTLFWFLATAAAANLLYNINYEIAEDKDAYYLPVFLVLSLAAALGTRFAAETRALKSWGKIRPDRVVAGLCC